MHRDRRVRRNSPMPGQRIDASEPCRPVKALWEKRHQDRHRYNVRTARPAVASSWSKDPLAPQPRYGHLDYNPSKAMVQEARYAAIEYENSLLLGKMRRIMSAPVVDQQARGSCLEPRESPSAR